MKTLLQLCVLSATLAAMACTTLVRANWNRIQPGMPKKKVITIVGEPLRRTYDGDLQKGTGETWYYDYRDPQTYRIEPKWIKFRDARVVAAGDDLARLEDLKKAQAQTTKTEKASEQPPTMPADIGFQCEQNLQCQSGKCVKHKCVGIDDCTGVPGVSCTSNLDCCSRHCNLGARQCD